MKTDGRKETWTNWECHYYIIPLDFEGIFPVPKTYSSLFTVYNIFINV